jgi:large subunit ribosomal protein L33
VRLLSTAQTGFFYTTKRTRLGPRLSAVKYDPKGAQRSCFLLLCGAGLTQACVTVKARVLFVESRKTKK